MAFSLLGLLIFLALAAGIVAVAGFSISKLGSRPSFEREHLDRLREVLDRLSDVESRIDELADTTARVAELEERADVTERVLAEVRAHKAVPPGGD